MLDVNSKRGASWINFSLSFSSIDWSVLNSEFVIPSLASSWKRYLGQMLVELFFAKNNSTEISHQDSEIVSEVGSEANSTDPWG